MKLNRCLIAYWNLWKVYETIFSIISVAINLSIFWQRLYVTTNTSEGRCVQKIKNIDLLLYYRNKRILRSKTLKLYAKISGCEFDFIALTETWLTQDILNSECFLLHFLRCNRNFERIEISGGGGVLFTTRNKKSVEYIGFSVLLNTLPPLNIVGCKCIRFFIFIVYFR